MSSYPFYLPGQGLSPGFPSGTTAGVQSTNPRYGFGQNPSPFYSISNQFLPRTLQDVIKWARYITVQSPTTVEVIRKMTTYPITEFLIDTQNPGTKDRYKALIKSIKLKMVLQDAGFDFYTLGNVFISIYFPITRMAICPNCGTSYNTRKVGFLQFKSYRFKGTCPSPGCGHSGDFEVRDMKNTDINSINVVKWAAENISVNFNPITGESEYYYKIPNEIKKKVMLGDRMFVSTIPWGFIDAIKNNQDFLLDSSNVFHLKNISMGSVLPGLGLPPIISLYSLIFYQAMLRKANESIAAEYLTPMRVIFPQPQTANSDPVVSMSMASFSANMEAALKKHKQDQNHILLSPVPVGYTNVGGEGKNLLIAQEIIQAEETILLGMGASRELLSGTTNWTSSTVGLRLLENTLLGYSSQIQELISWIIEKLTAYLQYESVPVTLTPFKLMDDDNARQLMMQLVLNGKASMSGLFESMGLDFDEELEKLKKDAVSLAENEVETTYETSKAKFIKSKELADSGQDTSGYNTSLDEAHSIAQQLIEQDEGTKRSTLMQIKQADPALYGQVVEILEEFSASPEHKEEVAAKSQGVIENAAQETQAAQAKEQGDKEKAAA